jgi:transcriptional regulator with AAA-type ATPase domain
MLLMIDQKVREDAASLLHLPERLGDGFFEGQPANFKLKLAQSAVRKNHGNKTLAARSLNISRPYLHRLLRIEGEDRFADDSNPELDAMATLHPNQFTASIRDNSRLTSS